MNPFSFSLYDVLRSLILPLGEIDRILPKSGTIIDLGCGQGVIAKYLAKIKSRKVVGVDNDIKRLPKFRTKNLKFVKADIRNFTLNNASGAILSDVLHHTSYRQQKFLLENIYKGLRKNGVLLIKEIDSGEFVRSHFSRIWDLIFYPKDKIYYLNSRQFKTSLQNLGFKVTILRSARFFPGSTTLYICHK